MSSAQLTIISGRSGSGKSTALHVLEDAGFNCIDNLPVGLLPELAARAQPLGAPCAVSIDARNLPAELDRFAEIIAELRNTHGSHLRIEVIFLDASITTLVRRFSETRRRHPLTGHGRTLPEALAAESSLLDGIATGADLRIDTTELGFHDLRRLIRERVVQRQQNGIAITFMSFAYSRGVPVDADLVFDARCLPNPHWDERLRAQTGRDPEVRSWLAAEPMVSTMGDQILAFLEYWLPEYAHSNRSYMTIAIGCTGGRHRSVYLAETLAEQFRAARPDVLVRHRDLN